MKIAINQLYIARVQCRKLIWHGQTCYCIHGTTSFPHPNCQKKWGGGQCSEADPGFWKFPFKWTAAEVYYPHPAGYPHRMAAWAAPEAPLHWGCKATAGKAAVAAQVQPPTGIGLHLQRICSLNCKPTAVEAANTLPMQSFCSAHCKPTAWEVLLQSPLQTNCNSSGSHLGFGVMTPNLTKFNLC